MTDYFETHGESDSTEIYDYWYELYFLLSTLPLDRPEIRSSPEILERFRRARWQADHATVERYWHRVSWTAAQCHGRILEIGAGMGNVTRWIAANPRVTHVVAVDLQERYVQALQGFALAKVVPMCANIQSDETLIAPHGPFDTVVLSELIEHLRFPEEIELRDATRRYLKPTVRWVITTPIGFMRDPDHKRGFATRWLRIRSTLLYGSIVATGDNTIQQFVTCQQRPTTRGRRFLQDRVAQVFDWAFHNRPSGQPWTTLSVVRSLPRRALGKIRRGVSRIFANKNEPGPRRG